METQTPRTHTFTIEVKEQYLSIQPCSVQAYEGDSIVFNYQGSTEAKVSFVDSSPFKEMSFPLSAGRSPSKSVSDSKPQSYGFVVSTNPSGGGTIIVIPG